jgi:hypothetical protein
LRCGDLIEQQLPLKIRSQLVEAGLVDPLTQLLDCEVYDLDVAEMSRLTDATRLLDAALAWSKAFCRSS